MFSVRNGCENCRRKVFLSLFIWKCGKCSQNHEIDLSFMIILDMADRDIVPSIPQDLPSSGNLKVYRNKNSTKTTMISAGADTDRQDTVRSTSLLQSRVKAPSLFLQPERECSQLLALSIHNVNLNSA